MARKSPPSIRQCLNGMKVSNETFQLFLQQEYHMRTLPEGPIRYPAVPMQTVNEVFEISDSERTETGT